MDNPEVAMIYGASTQISMAAQWYQHQYVVEPLAHAVATFVEHFVLLCSKLCTSEQDKIVVCSYLVAPLRDWVCQQQHSAQDERAEVNSVFILLNTNASVLLPASPLS
jgi:hypothetical protein